MAETTAKTTAKTTTKSTTKKTTSKATKPTKTTGTANKNIEKTEPKEKTAEQEIPVAKKVSPKDVDIHEIVVVRNGFRGPLTYISKKTGEEFLWEEFGDEQDMEIGELRSAKSSNKKFFINNWFMFDDEYAWVIDYLGLANYYKFTRAVDDFDKLFELSESELRSEIGAMSPGLKRTVAYRTRELIANGEIDSNKLILLLEEVLETELIERDH